MLPFAVTGVGMASMRSWNSRAGTRVTTCPGLARTLPGSIGQSWSVGQVLSRSLEEKA